VQDLPQHQGDGLEGAGDLREVDRRQGGEEVVADGILLDGGHARCPVSWRERTPLSAVHSQ
jgi:hypothetical protein